MKRNLKITNWQIILVVCFFPFLAHGQNLVPNSSFEGLNKKPLVKNIRNAFEYEPLSGYQPFQKNLLHWKAASEATPDLRIVKQANWRECELYHKDCNKAHTGDHVVGIMTYLRNTNTDSFREYVQVKLKEALKPGVTTYCELWIQKDRQAKLVSNNIGFFFSQKKFFVESEDPILKIPQVNFDSIINRDGVEWVKIEGSFVPDEPLIYLTIGNFYNNENTKVERFKNFRGSPYTPPYAHYLLDDIRVWQEGQAIQDTEDNPTTNADFDLRMTEAAPTLLENIYFEFDKAILKRESFVELNKLFTFLQKNQSIQIIIRGHTDNRGDAAYNLKLSTSRAQAVMNFLINKGIDATRLKASGLGETHPVASNNDEVGRAKNRRVEVEIMQGKNSIGKK
ncbi:MAG: OmpA family protein [Bacteroidota bacterium]